MTGIAWESWIPEQHSGFARLLCDYSICQETGDAYIEDDDLCQILR